VLKRIAFCFREPQLFLGQREQGHHEGKVGVIGDDDLGGSDKLDTLLAQLTIFPNYLFSRYPALLPVMHCGVNDPLQGSRLKIKFAFGLGI
jgi:hypothetical protein